MSDKIRVPRPTVAALVVVMTWFILAVGLTLAANRWLVPAPKESPISQSKEGI